MAMDDWLLTKHEKLLRRETVLTFVWPQMALICAREASPHHSRFEEEEAGAVKEGVGSGGRGRGEKR